MRDDGARFAAKQRRQPEGDFYPLTTCDLRDDVCVAWQFDRPDLGEGLIQAFRRANAEDDLLSLNLRGLEPNSEYTMVDLDNPGETTAMTGSKLMSDGFPIRLPRQNSAMLYHYRKAKSVRTGIVTRR